MRAWLMGVALLWGLSAVLQAATITETLTGTITAGGQNVEANNGANDPLDLFGGGDLNGTTATLTFSIDLGALATCVASNNNCQYQTEGNDTEYFDDETGDGIFSNTVTAGTGTVTVSNISSGQPEIESEGTLYNYTNRGIASAVGAVGPGFQQTENVNESFFGSGQIPLGEGDNLALLEAFMTGVTSAQFFIQDSSPDENNYEYFTVSDLTLLSNTPEPATVLLCALAGC